MGALATARQNMVESQIRTNDVTDSRVLSAMRDLPREAFLPPSMRDIAYMDEDLTLVPASKDRSARYLMSPLCFAKMVQAANIGATDLVLDVGSSVGYSTAVLARLAESVVGLECDESLAAQASKTLETLSIDNAAIVTGPLEAGYPGEGPYDVLLLGGSVSFVPDALFDQLKEGGRLLAVIGTEGLGRLCIYAKITGEITERPLYDLGVGALPGFVQETSFSL